MFLSAVFLVTRGSFKALVGEEHLPTGQDHTLNHQGLSSVLQWGGGGASQPLLWCVVMRGDPRHRVLFFHFPPHFIPIVDIYS